MNRVKALEVSRLLDKIETLEALIDELTHLKTLERVYEYYGDASNLEEELVAVVQTKLDVLLKRLEEM